MTFQLIVFPWHLLLQVQTIDSLLDKIAGLQKYFFIIILEKFLKYFWTIFGPYTITKYVVFLNSSFMMAGWKKYIDSCFRIVLFLCPAYVFSIHLLIQKKKIFIKNHENLIFFYHPWIEHNPENFFRNPNPLQLLTM